MQHASLEYGSKLDTFHQTYYKVSGVVNAPPGLIWARNIAHKHCAQGVRSVQHDGPEATDHITCGMITGTTMNVRKSLVRTFGSICTGHLYEVTRTYTKCTACCIEMIWSVLVSVCRQKKCATDIVTWHERLQL